MPQSALGLVFTDYIELPRLNCKEYNQSDYMSNICLSCLTSVSMTISRPVRKHLTGGFLCAALDLSGILWSLLRGEARLSQLSQG